MVIFEKADIFLLNKWKNWSPEVNFFGTFPEFFKISNKFNDLVIFKKADLFYLTNEIFEAQ